ncbi:MAG: hypoxanthine phosphoribosyltransferase [Ardenticatenaceae bacterium]|nr:hypoxanthine phosphoribosyltransferase [Ardenticatenaceae bacterium]
MNDYHPEIEQIILSADEIQHRIDALAQEISDDYAAVLEAGEEVLLIGILKGVFMFMADLTRCLTIPVQIHFMDVADMEDHTRKTGLIEVNNHFTSSIKGRHVLLLEDVVDAGLTLNYLIRSLTLNEPKSLTVCTLFSKQEERLIDTEIKYTGFELDNLYVVGYGLDYKEKYRNLPFLGLLKPEAMT